MQKSILMEVVFDLYRIGRKRMENALMVNLL